MNKPRRRKSRTPAIRLRGRIAIEIGRRSALTEAGADLLEQIAISGSLSQAARQLGFSYRWAWLLVDSINRSWPAPLVATATGGKKGGGAALTDFGSTVLSAYRLVQIELEHFLDLQTLALQRAIALPAP